MSSLRQTSPPTQPQNQRPSQAPPHSHVFLHEGTLKRKKSVERHEIERKMRIRMSVEAKEPWPWWIFSAHTLS